MKNEAKKSILQATIKLIEEKGRNPEDVTVREICRKAGVGVGQINYHFQTKEHLIEQCIQIIIGEVIGTFDSIAASLPEMGALEKLKYMMNSTMSFLFANENISRISILTDHKSAADKDNTSQSVTVYLPLVEAVCTERNISVKPQTISTLLALTMQGIFLRADRIKNELGVDLRNAQQRRDFINEYTEVFLHGY